MAGRARNDRPRPFATLATRHARLVGYVPRSHRGLARSPKARHCRVFAWSPRYLSRTRARGPPPLRLLRADLSPRAARCRPVAAHGRESGRVPRRGPARCTGCSSWAPARTSSRCGTCSRTSRRDQLGDAVAGHHEAATRVDVAAPAALSPAGNITSGRWSFSPEGGYYLGTDVKGDRDERFHERDRHPASGPRRTGGCGRATTPDTSAPWLSRVITPSTACAVRWPSMCCAARGSLSGIVPARVRSS